ncbi:GTPase [Clostridium algidicarnis]|uniref:GTPase n=1 Tax=Clostridium algidicarnis TaxID=37659 RepID=UPI0016237C03|nr:GTPase [Clostridium algidicarnis]MBB6698771.1 50S ribosome-binding GTPase [Clostridium algidicarnis]
MDKSFNADSFNIDEELEKINKKISKPNILVCGATGVGKSSFVNDVFGKCVAKVGEGAPITRGVKRYEDKELSVVLYDSEGYEIGEDKQYYFKEEIIGVIDKCKQEYPTELNKQIHEVWYFISAANKRVTETDIEVVNLIKEKKVPIAIVVTQIDNVDEKELNDICSTIEMEFRDIRYFTVCVTDDKDIAEAVEIYNQKQQLIEWALENLSNSLKDGFIVSLHNNLEIVKKHVNKVIVPSYIASAIAASAVPIPLADAAMLTPIQLSMSVHIMKVYGIDNYKSAITGVINSSIVSQIGKTLAKTLIGNVAKLIPGFGSVVGGLINSSVAGTLTASIGYAISELSYRYSQSVVEGKAIPLTEIFDSEIIRETINNFYKQEAKSE